jgi:uncharacterized protein (DUF342 family)
MDQNINNIQNDLGYSLTISKDKMEAYIRPIETPPPEINADSIKNLLELEGISFGVVDDGRIAAYLASNPSMDKPWKIAKGMPVKSGRPPEIKCYFDTAPLKAGTIDDSGAIDFRNRGEIPQVKEGEIVAEIIPEKKGAPGKDIYGNILAPPEYNDIAVACGTGVQKSEKDPLKFIAQIKGRPELLNDGTICVSRVMLIPGDIGVETGHVEFDGHIEVKGSIQKGYRVKGKTLSADEILQANLEIEGDIVVLKGIIGANIHSDGAIKARHIRDAVIDSLGDINIEAEVFESKIETNGALNMEQGTIRSSTISAMRGINVGGIGSHSSIPCKLVVGVDNRIEKKIVGKNLEIAEKDKEKEIPESQIEKLRNEGENLENLIGEMTQEEASINMKGRSLKATLEKLKEVNDSANTAKVLQLIRHQNLELTQVKKRLEKLIGEQDQIENKIQECESQIKDCESGIQELQDDINSLIGIGKMKKHSATVKISKAVTEHTSIKGPHTSLITKKDLHRVSVQEVKNTDPNIEEEWVMIVSQLK